MRKNFLPSLTQLACVLALAASSVTAAAQLPTPTPLAVAAGPLGAVQVSGVVSGAALSASPQVAGGSGGLNLTNAFVILQRATGAWRFYVQAGAYSLPALGAPRRSTLAYTGVFGPAPQAYAEWKGGRSWSLRAGILPTMIGQENTFSYLNFNIERGVIWNDMENAVSRGAQFNYHRGRWSAALQYGDGFFSGDYGAVSAMGGYQLTGQDSISLVGLWPNRATPPNATFQDANARLLDLMYTHTGKRWTWEPYLLAFSSPASRSLGYQRTASAVGAAVLADYHWSRRWSLAARGEFAVGGGAGDLSAHQNILGFGPGARVFTFTVTPTWQDGGLFARADVSWVELARFAPGLGFGALGQDGGQFGAAIEAGVAF